MYKLVKAVFFCEAYRKVAATARLGHKKNCEHWETFLGFVGLGDCILDFLKQYWTRRLCWSFLYTFKTFFSHLIIISFKMRKVKRIIMCSL